MNIKEAVISKGKGLKEFIIGETYRDLSHTPDSILNKALAENGYHINAFQFRGQMWEKGRLNLPYALEINERSHEIVMARLQAHQQELPEDLQTSLPIIGEIVNTFAYHPFHFGSDRFDPFESLASQVLVDFLSHPNGIGQTKEVAIKMAEYNFITMRQKKDSPYIYLNRAFDPYIT